MVQTYHPAFSLRNGSFNNTIFLYVLTCFNYIQFGLGVSIHSKATVQTVWASWPRIICVPSSGATSIGKRWWRSKPVTSWKKIQCGLACEVIKKEPFCNNMCTAPQPRTKKHVETTPLSCWPGQFFGKILIDRMNQNLGQLRRWVMCFLTYRSIGNPPELRNLCGILFVVGHRFGPMKMRNAGAPSDPQFDH